MVGSGIFPKYSDQPKNLPRTNTLAYLPDESATKKRKMYTTDVRPSALHRCPEGLYVFARFAALTYPQPGNDNERERLSTVDLLIKAACFGKKLNNVCIIKNI
jgi:hypothetical protein